MDKWKSIQDDVIKCIERAIAQEGDGKEISLIGAGGDFVEGQSRECESSGV